MNENINLCEILRDCPKGTKFYSYIFGDETYFQGFSLYEGKPISIIIYGKKENGRISVCHAKDTLTLITMENVAFFPAKKCAIGANSPLLGSKGRGLTQRR